LPAPHLRGTASLSEAVQVGLGDGDLLVCRWLGQLR
jgi:hypothetical protein